MLIHLKTIFRIQQYLWHLLPSSMHKPFQAYSLHCLLQEYHTQYQKYDRQYGWNKLGKTFRKLKRHRPENFTNSCNNKINPWIHKISSKKIRMGSGDYMNSGALIPKSFREFLRVILEASTSFNLKSSCSEPITC